MEIYSPPVRTTVPRWFLALHALHAKIPVMDSCDAGLWKGGPPGSPCPREAFPLSCRYPPRGMKNDRPGSEGYCPTF